MNIAFLHHSLPDGGAEQVSLDVARHLRERWAVRPFFFCVRWDEKSCSTSVEELGSIIILPDRGGKLGSKTNRDFIVQALKFYDIDWLIVGTNFAEGDLLACIRQETTCRTIYYLHSIPLWQAKAHRYRWEAHRDRSPWMRALWSVAGGLITHLIESNIERSKADYLRRLREYDAMITLTEAYRTELIQLFALQADTADRVYTVINTLEPVPRPSLETKAHEIVYIGRLERAQKRVDRLLLAWAKAQPRLEGWKLSIYGTGKDEVYLKQLADKLGLRAVEFKGWTTDSAGVFRRASVSCQTSTFEGWPLSLVESQRMGAVPIAMDCCSGVREIIGSDKQYGRLVTAGDVNAFAEVLVETCLDERLRHEIAERMIDAQARFLPEVNDEVWAKLLGLPQAE